MVRIYTRTGDSGKTSLFGGDRIPKSDPRVELYGEVDELNGNIGRAIATGGDEAAATGLAVEVSGLLDELTGIQRSLFELGAVLADPRRSARIAAGEEEAPALDPAGLEAAIDRLESGLPPLRLFILPGGGPGGAELHVARTVCRRVERRAVAAAAVTVVPAEALIFLNRLSDYLFVAARWLNHLLGRGETEWSGGGDR